MPSLCAKTAEARLTLILKREAEKELSDAKKTGAGADKQLKGKGVKQIELFLDNVRTLSEVSQPAGLNECLSVKG